MKVFLTGATGYIGSVVAEKLKGKGHQVLGLARNEAAEAKLRMRGIEAIARLLDVKAKSISIEEAQKQFGAMTGFFSINNQLSAEKARRELGWKPKFENGISDDIENGSYRNLK